tara:strand:+ start:1130 stop:3490 length:2361 start_codon:yes stop_codon:yes gene_type:complete
MWKRSKRKGIIVFISFLLFIVSFSPDVTATCGDGVCNETETCSTCNQDCGICCGNGIQDLGEDCKTCSQDVSCGINQACSNDGECIILGTVNDCAFIGNKCLSNQECFNNQCRNKCGNSIQDVGENCANCPQDIKCGYNHVCNSIGNCILLGTNENCASLGNTCPYNQECINKICKNTCGNRKRDGWETCINCPGDVPCRAGWVCSNMGLCVELGTSTNCASPGDSCGIGYCVNGKCVECITNKHCESKKVYEGIFVCSPDNKHVLEKGYELSGVCKEGKCTGKKIPITPRDYMDCEDSFCQDGTCDCSEGFNACKKTGKCEKIGNLKENVKCGCDFQCESEYCSSDGICINPLNVVLSSTKNKISVGEETIVTLSVDNELNTNVNVNFAINIGDGLEMSEVVSGMDCSGNQCKSSIKIPERGREEVTVALVGEKAIVGKIEAQVTYFMDDLIERTLKNIEDVNIIVNHCGDSACTEGETMQNCCMDCGCPNAGILSDYTCSINKGCEKKTKDNILIWFYILILVGSIYGYIQYRRWKEDEGRIGGEKEKIRQKNKVKEILRTLNLSPKKHPTPKEIIKKLKDGYHVDYEDNLIREAYIEFLNKLEGKHQYSDKTTDIALTKFCSNCGKLTRKNKEFCHNCGKSVTEPSTEKIMKYCGKCGEGIKEIGDFCPYCGKKIAHKIAGLNTYQSFYKKVPKSDKRSEKFKVEKSKIKQKNRIVALILAVLLWPLMAGYLYLGRWKRFWISIVIVYSITLFFGDNASVYRNIFIILTAIDCYSLAKETQKR